MQFRGLSMNGLVCNTSKSQSRCHNFLFLSLLGRLSPWSPTKTCASTFSTGAPPIPGVQLSLPLGCCAQELSTYPKDHHPIQPPTTSFRVSVVRGSLCPCASPSRVSTLLPVHEVFRECALTRCSTEKTAGLECVVDK